MPSFPTSGMAPRMLVLIIDVRLRKEQMEDRLHCRSESTGRLEPYHGAPVVYIYTGEFYNYIESIRWKPIYLEAIQLVHQVV